MRGKNWQAPTVWPWYVHHSKQNYASYECSVRYSTSWSSTRLANWERRSSVGVFGPGSRKSNPCPKIYQWGCGSCTRTGLFSLKVEHPPWILLPINAVLHLVGTVAPFVCTENILSFFRILQQALYFPAFTRVGGQSGKRVKWDRWKNPFTQFFDSLIKYVFSCGEKHCPPPNYWGIGPLHCTAN